MADLPDPEAPEQVVISVEDLIEMAIDAANHMGENNPHRLLFLNCAYAMQQLGRRVAFHEGASEVQ